MRKLRFSFVNGSEAQLTAHELLQFFRQPTTVACFALAAVALFVFQPFPELAVLPVAEQVVFWGITFPGSFLIYLGTSLLLAHRFRRGRTLIGHVVASVIVGLVSPELAVALGMDPNATAPADRLLVCGFVLVSGVALEFLIVTYVLPAYLRGLAETVEDAPADLPGFADVTPNAEGQAVVLLGRRFRLPELLLVSSEEHYVHIHTVAGRHMLRGRISDIEAQLPDAWGLRIHRSHWVASRSVRALHKARDGWTLELSDGQTLPVARARREAVAEWVAGLRDR